MKYFLIEYHRFKGLQQVEVYEDSETAMDQRIQLEGVYRKDLNYEVVVLSAETFGQILNTHAKYFFTEEELFEKMRDEMRLDDYKEALRDESLLRKLVEEESGLKGLDIYNRRKREERGSVT